MNQTISAIIPTRKGNATIARAVKSILAQTKQPVEILIISDHLLDKADDKEHADRLTEVLRSSFAADMDSKKIRIIDGKAMGPGIARNLGARAAAGDLIAFLDDDDIWADETKLEKQAEYLDMHPNIDIVGTETTYFIREETDNGKTVRFQTVTQPTDPADVRNQMLLKNPLMTSSVLMRRKALLDAGGFKHMYLAEDYELWLRINRHNNRIANVPGTYIEYTVRSGSASQKRHVRIAWNVFFLVAKNFVFYPNGFGIIKTKWPVFKRLIRRLLSK